MKHIEASRKWFSVLFFKPRVFWEELYSVRLINGNGSARGKSWHSRGMGLPRWEKGTTGFQIAVGVTPVKPVLLLSNTKQ